MGRIKLVRIHLPVDALKRVDELAAAYALATGRKVAHAAVMRVVLLAGLAGEPDLAALLREDPVKRGRKPGWEPPPFRSGGMA